MAYLDERKSPVIIPNPDAENFGPGKRGIFRFPVGVTYWESILKPTVGGAAATRAQIETDIEQLTLRANAKEKWSLTGKQLVAFNEFHRAGSVANTGNLPMFFRRPWMQLLANQEGPQFGTADIDSLNLEVKIAGGGAIDGCKLTHRQIGPTPLGTHQKLIAENRPYAAIGTQQIFDLPRDPSTKLCALHIQTDPAHVTRIQLKADGFNEMDVTVAELAEFYRLENAGKTPQAGFVHLDFLARNLFGDAIPLTMNRLELAITYDAAPGNVPILMDLAVPSDTPAAQASRRAA